MKHNMMHKHAAGRAAALLVALAAPNLAHAQNGATPDGSTEAGPFQVMLIAAPQVGRTHFETRVWRAGQLVTDAKVSMNLRMPYHRHGATVQPLQSETSLSLTGVQYAADAKLMEGIYEARVSVKAGNDKGTALFGFTTRRSAPIAHLGMWHQADAFEVQLTTDPASTTGKVGYNHFRVQVTRQGQPVTDATVALTISMPGMKMAGWRAYTELKAANGGYEGSSNVLHAGSNYQAHIKVQSGGQTGEAVYDFPVR